MVVILIAWAIVSLLKPATLDITPTNISLDSGVTISGDKIITYNGSSFIEISPVDNTTKVIYTPKTRFPSVKDMVYVPNKGVFLTFSGNTIETPVFDYKIKQNAKVPSDDPESSYIYSLTSDDNYTWYLDFKSGKLLNVVEYEVNSDYMYYNSHDDKFYFITGNGNDNPYQFKSYDINTNKTETVSGKLGLYSIDKLRQCGDSTCVIGKLNSSRDRSTLAKISSKGKVSSIKNVNGAILSTPDSMTFAYLTDSDDTALEDEDATDEYDDEDEDGGYSDGIAVYQTMEVTNISTGESSDYSGSFNAGGAIGTYDDHFYYMNGIDGTYQYLKRSGHDIDFNYDDDEYDFSDGFINLGKVGQSFSLIADVDREIYLVSTGLNTGVFDKASNAVVSKNIDTCVDKVNSDITVQNQDDITTDYDIDFEIMVPDDDDFDATINKVNDCIGKDSDNLVGYSYLFTGVSPINGKITTE
ncbi:MAG: hypothetical protein L0H38_00980 [bacterium]|nr:hypothetical protein [bacterium]